MPRQHGVHAENVLTVCVSVLTKRMDAISRKPECLGRTSIFTFPATQKQGLSERPTAPPIPLNSPAIWPRPGGAYGCDNGSNGSPDPTLEDAFELYVS